MKFGNRISAARFIAVSLVAAMMLLVAAERSIAADTRDDANAANDAGMSFHRVYAPADRIDEWPRGAVRYVPMDRDAFERAVAEIAAEAKAPLNEKTQVERATYSARLDDAGVLRGSAELSITHSADQPVLLPLGDCELTLTAAAWTHAPTQAVLGVGRDGKLSVLVERSGTLRLDFALRTTAETGRSLFRAKIPAGVVTRWILDLPSAMNPTTEDGHIEATPAKLSMQDESDTTADASVEARRTWQLELGSRNQLTLALNSPAPDRDRFVVATQVTDYAIAASGVTFISKYAFDAIQEIPNRITFQLDAEARHLSTDIDGKSAKVISQRRANGGEQWITIESPQLPAAAANGSRTLSIRAYAPSKLQARWRLPRIVLEDVPWQDAELRITSDPPLRISQLWPTHAQPSAGVTPIAATLTCLAADASVEVVVDWAPRDVHATSALLLELGSEARGQVVLDAQFPDAARATLSARIDEHWVVEGVTATPAELIADWRVTPDAQGRESLIVECRSNASKRARIVAAVRRRESPELRPIDAAQLSAIDWSPSCKVASSVVSIAASRAYQLSTVGGHRLLPVAQSDEANQLLADHASQLKFHLSSAGPRFSVAARRAATPFRGEIEIESYVTAESVRDTFRLRGIPQGDGLTQIVARVTPPSSEPVAWSDAANAGETLSAYRLSDSELRAFLLEPGTEAYRFTFAEPRATPFEIVGERTRKFTASAPVALAAFYNAAAQTGLITIRSSAETRIAIDNRRLTAIPPRDESLSELSEIRGVYRFVPSRDANNTDVATVSCVDDAPDAGAVAYVSRLTVRLHPDGKAIWTVGYDIETFAQQQLALTLPESATRYDITVDGQIATSGTNAGAPIGVALPKTRRFVSVVVAFESAVDALAFYSRRSLQAPTIDVPVLQRHWEMWLPTEFDVASTERSDQRQLSLSQRVFGPLGRSNAETPISPIRWTDENTARANAATARANSERLLESLAAARKTASTESVPSWSQLLSRIDDEQFYVDASALDRVGIAPWTPTPPAPRERAAAARLLLESELAIVSDGTHTLLTTSAAAASLPDVAPLLIEPRNDLQRAVYFSPRLVTTANTVPARVWSQASTTSLPWLVDRTDATWPGWRQVELAGNDDVMSLEIVNLQTIRTAAWIVFLAAAAVAWRYCRHSRAIWWAMAGTAVVALLIGDGQIHFAPILWGVLWGLAVGALVAILPKRTRREVRSVQPHSAASWRRKRAATVASFLLVALWVVRSTAQEKSPTPDAKAAPPTKHIHQVFFPVDDDRQPVGSRVYVPEALFTRLERYTLDRQRGPRGALFTSASHQVQLDWNADGTSLEPGSTAALLEIVTFEDEVEVRLPIPVTSAKADDDAGERESATPAIRLDGVLLEPSEVSIKSGVATFQITKTGTHRIEVPLRQSASKREGREGLAIEPIAAGLMRLEVSAPENSPELEVAAAGAGTVLSRGRGMLVLPLTSATTYSLHWAAAPVRPADGRLESAERLWLDVRPTMVTLTAEVTLVSTTSLPEELRIAADPRLVPIAATVDGKRTTWRRTGAADENLVFHLSKINAREATFLAKFHLRDTAGIGTLRLPRWEPAVAEVRRRWLAVNIDESLDHEISVGPETLPMTVVDFVQDEAEDAPLQYAYRLPSASVNWSLTTRPKINRIRVDQTLAIIGEPNRAAVTLDADVAIASGDIYDHIVRCDPRLRVSRVTVTENGASRATYWTQSADGVVQIFLRERAGAQQHLRLEGHVPASAVNKITVADVVLEGAERTRAQLKLYRLPSVRLSVENVTGYADAQASTAPSSSRPTSEPNRVTLPPQSRLLREFAANGDSAPAITLQLEANAPKVDATSVVTIDEISADAWSVRGEFRGTVSDGMLDEIMLDLPGEWIGDPVVEPAMPSVTTDSPGSGRRLTVRPVLPLRRAFALTVSGRIRPPANSAAPRWRLLDADSHQEFSVLPTLWAGRFLGWDLTEMRRGAPGEGFLLPVREGARYEAYQLVGDRAAAVLQAEVPRVRTLEAYVDVVAAPLGSNSHSVVATYDLIPSGVRSCRIAMPQGSKLIAAMLDDRRQTPHNAGKNEWRIDLHSDSLPQRLSIVAIVPAESKSNDSQSWQAPALLDAKIRHTTWCIPSDNTIANAARNNVSLDDARTAASVRADSLAKLCAVAATSSVEQKSSAVRRWQRRLAAALPPTNASAPAINSSYVIVGDASTSLVRNNQTLVQQFGAADLGRFGAEQVFELPAAQAQRFAEQLLRDGGPTARAMVVASPPKMLDAAALLRRSNDNHFRDAVSTGNMWSLETTSATMNDWPWKRWLLAASIAAVSLALLRTAVRRRVFQELAQAPYLTLASAGVAWWLWLSPSWFGWIIIALALLFAWRLAWSLPRVDPRMRPSSGA